MDAEEEAEEHSRLKLKEASLQREPAVSAGGSATSVSSSVARLSKRWLPSATSPGLLFPRLAAFLIKTQCEREEEVKVTSLSKKTEAVLSRTEILLSVLAVKLPPRDLS
ncbi:hypothetical protein MUK42_35152 [Musa troglodytarum]|uniref:Uncharacterized protein n=1 Tax=Musa troglodytarum TaxID=320322 RepID=A0A9E7JAW7_9LILI|nr:hypothetical protein MUK42_35152 [Musa troglodytarum]